MSENIVVETAERIFADLADPQTVNADANGSWKAPLWNALTEAGLPLAWVPEACDGAGASLADGFGVLSAAGRFGIAVPLAETLLAGWLLAKAGIAAMALVAAQELGRYGVRVNAIAPIARTRLTEDVPMIGEMMKAPEDPGALDAFNPAEVSPLVAYLASSDCSLTGRLFAVQGGMIAECRNWEMGDPLTVEEPWTVDLVADRLGASVAS